MQILLVHDFVGRESPPDEQDTMVQVDQIESALRRLGHAVSRYPFHGDLLDLEHQLRTGAVDVVFNLVETFHGSRMLHVIPLLCEELGIKVTGGNSTSLFFSGDKLLAKRMMVLAGIPTPAWVDREASGKWHQFLGVPLIRKPRSEEASVGIDDDSVVTCDTTEELAVQLDSAKRMILERYIDGHECNVTVVSDEGRVSVLPIAQMLFVDYPPSKPRIVGYEAKWVDSSFAYQHTVRSYSFGKEYPDLSEKVRSIVDACWQLFDCTGYGRVDIRIDEFGFPYVLEMNMNPCLTKDSGFIAACEQAGIGYDEAISRILKEALRG